MSDTPNRSLGRRLLQRAGIAGFTGIAPVLDIARPIVPGVRWTATTTHGTHLLLPDRASAQTVAVALRSAGHGAARALDCRVLLDD